MKRITSAVFLCLILIFFFTACTSKDKTAWNEATTKNTIESFKEYMKQFPKGKYGADAQTKIISLTPKIGQPVISDGIKITVTGSHSLPELKGMLGNYKANSGKTFLIVDVEFVNVDKVPRKLPLQKRDAIIIGQDGHQLDADGFTFSKDSAWLLGYGFTNDVATAPGSTFLVSSLAFTLDQASTQSYKFRYRNSQEILLKQ
jgi:hypothetical protein